MSDRARLYRPAFAVAAAITLALIAVPLAFARQDREVRDVRTSSADGLYLDQVLLYDCPEGCSGAAGFYWVWRVDPDGVIRRVKGLGARESYSTPTPPTISPDGRWIAYASPHRRLVVQQLDLAAGVAVGPAVALPSVRTEFNEATVPAWSPDSGALAVVGRVGRMRGLWVVNRDGTGLRRIVCSCDVEAQDDVDRGEWPAWSRDGQIAFTGSPRRYGERTALHVVTADGTGLKRITQWRRNFVAGYPAWAPDASKLAFSLFNGYDGETFVLNLLPGGRRSISGAIAPAWSPDGEAFAYLDDHGVAVTSALGDGPVRHLRQPRRLRDYGFVARLQWLAPG